MGNAKKVVKTGNPTANGKRRRTRRHAEEAGAPRCGAVGATLKGAYDRLCTRNGKAVAAILILFLVLRLWNIGYNPALHTAVLMDESTVYLGAKTLAQTGKFMMPEALDKHGLSYANIFQVGPLTTFLVASAYTFLGEGYAQFRLVSVLFGILTAIVLFLISRRLWGARAGIVTLALAAVDPLFMFYNRVAPHDAISYFFMASSAYMFLLFEDGGKKRNLVLSGVGAGLAFTARYAGLLILAPLLIYMVLTSRGRVKERLWQAGIMICASLIVLLAMLCWLALAGNSYLGTFIMTARMLASVSGLGASTGPFHDADFLPSVARTLAFYYPVMIPSVVLLAVMVFRGKMSSILPALRGKATPLFLWIAIGFLWWVQSVMNGKYSLMFGLPLLCVAGALASRAYERSRRATAAIVLLMVAAHLSLCMIYVADFTDSSYLSMAQVVRNIPERVYMYEPEIALFSGESLFPTYWPGAAHYMDVEAWGLNRVYEPPLTVTCAEYLEEARPGYILLSRNTRSLSTAPRGELRDIVENHGVLVESAGPYNLYRIDWERQANTDIVYNDQPDDIAAVIKRFIGSR